MKVFIVTQDEPFFLAEAIDYLLRTTPDGIAVVGAYVLEASPFGGKKSFARKVLDTIRIFGFRFFLFYAWRFAWNRLFGVKVADVFAKYGVATKTRITDINAAQSLEYLRSLAPDVIVSLASNQIFRDELLALPSCGCLNLHTGKLPKYRGLMPLFWAMCNGESEVGVTVFLMDKGIDTGPILRQETFPLADFSMHELIRITKIIGMRLVNLSLADLRDGTHTLMPNDNAQATVVRFPTRADTRRFSSIGKRFF